MNGDTFRPHGGDAIAVVGGEDAARAAHGNCFADEVVIDFPSVAPAVERMRSAFVDGDHALALEAKGPHCILAGHSSGQILRLGDPSEFDEADDEE